MEANLGGRHVCKLCNKSFPCGRSLGGHMRSHLTNNLGDNDEKHSRTSFQLANYSAGSISNMEEETDLEAGNLAGFGYGLRKNPKKTQKLEFLSEESPLPDKFCRECGKGFQSWKALFGHMKCHSERAAVSSSQELEEPDSNITDAKQKLVMDIQSDNETEAPNRRKRSRRRRTNGTTNSTSFSLATNSSSVSEMEQEQEVAVSLMLLSMDVGNWVNFNSPAEESSDNNSKFLQAPSVVESKTSVSNGGEFVKPNKKLKGKQSEQSSSGFMTKGKTIKKSQPDQRVGSKTSLKKHDQNQSRFSSVTFMKSPKKTLAEFWDSKIYKKPKKRSIFECDICNKIFHSYQALGGHRASHKKLKGCCLASAMEEEEEEEEEEMGSESSAEMAISANPAAESKLSKALNNGGRSEEEMGSQIPKKSSKHKCPICEKVFASGQALGGHKRSHLVSGSEAKNRETVEIQKQVPEVRGFLDLNLPPEPVEREIKDHNIVSLKPWWVAASEHNHEALVNVGFQF